MKDIIMNIEQDIFSPTIPLIRFQQVPIANVFTEVSATSTFSHEEDSHERINKSYWVSDYSEDIYETLLQTEMKRREIHFRSQQCHFRPMLLKLIKDACDCHKLCRITLHLAVHLLDCFMDKFTIRVDSLNLTALACLMIAAKIEEARINKPKFAKLNKFVGKMYTLNDFKRVECKVLTTFNFDLIRPTAATFSEYFSMRFITLNDYQKFLTLYQNENAINQYRLLDGQQQLQSNFLPCTTTISDPIIKLNSPYSSYNDMLTTLRKKYFELIDVSLNCLKFANIKPSIIASACIAAVRKMHSISPIWTTHLKDLTKYDSDTVQPFVDAILAVYRLQFKEEHSSIPYSFAAAAPAASTSFNAINDSLDSGVGLTNDLKSDTDNEHDDYQSDGDDSYGEADNENIEGGEHNESDKRKERNADDENEETLEYPLMSKRRRLL
uniref:Cyclin-like domain-containing protein n=1 Tax=Glossina brevipalpis TaxID=37001 RepID=A0A1A9WT47_9MUSC